jgi:hypothetical protein
MLLLLALVLVLVVLVALVALVALVLVVPASLQAWVTPVQPLIALLSPSLGRVEPSCLVGMTVPRKASL